ncbi:Holin family protein [compost metagenome]
MDNFYKQLVIAGSVAASFLFGGWSYLLSVLLAFVVIDYVTGIGAAAKEGALNSSKGFWGIAKKVSIFAIVAVAHLVDMTLGDAHLFRDAAIFFYLGNELISLLENAGRMGAPIPPVLKKAIEVLKGKGGENDISR